MSLETRFGSKPKRMTTGNRLWLKSLSLEPFVV